MAGKSNATRTPIMAMTTSNSTRVKPSRLPGRLHKSSVLSQEQKLIENN